MLKYTVGLLANHPKFKRPTQVKVFIDGRHGNVVMSVENAHTLAPIRALGHVTLSLEEYDDRPAGNIAFARWAFAKFGLEICE
ncbi:hypothetical protein ACIU0H_05180 [Pseudomonas aeruginosa]